MDASQLPEGVTLYYTDKAVHLTTNDALMTFLRQKGNGSLPLSRTILSGYEAECGAADPRVSGRRLCRLGARRRNARAAGREILPDRPAAEERDRRHRHGRAQRGHEPLGLRPAVARLRRAVPPARTQRVGVLLWNH